MNKNDRTQLAICVILYNECIVCYKKFKPTNKGMIFDPLCKECLEKKNNVGKYAGYTCDRGHYLTFERFVYPDRYEPYCKICRVFVFKINRTEQNNGNDQFSKSKS